MDLSRRSFCVAAGAATAGLMRGRVLPNGTAQPEIAKRKLGKTGWNATIYALGSAEIPPDAEASRAISRLVDAGVNYLDTAPSYQSARSEKVIGAVIRNRREKVFLATKTLARDAEGAYREVLASLERLQTDRIDLLQVHAVNDSGTLDQVLRKGGAVEGLERARREGKIRFVGITGHTRPEVIASALNRYPFDSILIPVSPLDVHLGDFAEGVIPQAEKLGIALVGMKALKGIERATGGRFEPGRFLRYALSLRLSTLTIGLRRESEVDENLRIVQNFQPMEKDERFAFEKEMRQHANDSTLWWKKTG